MSDSDNPFTAEEWRSARRLAGPWIGIMSFLAALGVAKAIWGLVILALFGLWFAVDFYRFAERKENEKIYEDLG